MDTRSGGQKDISILDTGVVEPSQQSSMKIRPDSSILYLWNLMILENAASSFPKWMQHFKNAASSIEYAASSINYAASSI